MKTVYLCPLKNMNVNWDDDSNPIYGNTMYTKMGIPISVETGGIYIDGKC